MVAPSPRRLGRPKKLRSAACGAVAGLRRRHLFGIYKRLKTEFPTLSRAEHRALVPLLAECAAKYSCMREAQRQRRGSKTNKNRTDVAVLVAECEAAWRTVVNKRVPQLPVGMRNGRPADVLTRIVHKTLTTKPYPFSLDRQARASRKLVFDRGCDRARISG